MRICRTCLATNVYLFNINDVEISDSFARLIGLSISKTDGLPPYICEVCTHLIHKFEVFIDICHSSLNRLQSNELTEENMNDVKWKMLFNLSPTVTEINSIEPTKSEPTFSDMINIDVFDDVTYVNKKCPSHYNIYTHKPKEENEGIVTKHNQLDFQQDTNLETENVLFIKIEHDGNEELNGEEKNDDENVLKNEYEISFHDESNGEENVDDENVAEDDYEEISIHEEEPFTYSAPKMSMKRTIETQTNDTDTAELKKPKQEKNICVKQKKTETVKESKKKICVRQEKTETVKKESKRDEDKRLKQELAEKCKNLNTFYSSFVCRGPSRQLFKKTMQFFDDFAEKYKVEIKFLTKEEQIKEFEETKSLFEHMAYQCQTCYQGYIKRDSYNTHLLLHEPATGKYKCDICGVRHRANRDLSQHIRKKHCTRFTCKICGKVTKNLQSARGHFDRHSNSLYKCKYCEKAFKSDANYWDHLRIAHNDGKMICRICERPFRGELGMSMHMSKQHRQAVQCNSCDLCFQNKNALIKHLEDSTDGACTAGIRACKQCGEGFPTDEELQKHCQQHRKEITYCIKCNKSFVSLRSLQDHSRIRHRPPARPAPPPRAARPSATRVARRRLDQKEFVCETCGLEFKYNFRLQQHRRLHTGERPYKCPYCDKTFRMCSSLLAHKKTHTDERKFKCTICSKAFRQCGHLSTHLITHTNDRPFKCKECPKTYTSCSNLREHVNTIHKGLPARQRNKK